MEINTKYDIGDEVWFLRDNKIKSSNIRLINVNKDDKAFNIYYRVLEGAQNMDHGFIEYELFPSKEELLKSL